MNYEVWHDEYKGDDSVDEYWHGIFFVPTERKKDIINILKVIRNEHKVEYSKDIKFAGCLSKPNNKNTQVIRNSLDLFSHLLMSKYGQKTDLYNRTKRDVYEQKCNPFHILTEIFNCKFVIFYIPCNHKSFSTYPMSYSERVETTFRIGLKGGCHYLFSKDNPINITKFYFDGYKHHGRHIDKNRILKGSFREYCIIPNDCIIDDRQMKDRDDDSKVLMSFVDNITGAWS